MATLARDVGAGLPRARRSLRGLVWLLLLVLLAAGVWWARNLRLPVNSLHVSGTFTHVTPARIRQIATPFVSAGLLRANLAGLRQALEKQPWVRRVAVSRHWPDAVSIRVWEAVPVARWSKDAVLAQDGRHFAVPAAQMPRHLPLLHGPKGSAKQLEQVYEAEKGAFAGKGMRLASLTVDSGQEWVATTDSGLVLKLGRQQVQKRLQRFLNTAVPALGSKLGDAAYVDLRYSNGFAVGWKPGSNPSSAGEK